MTSAAGQLTACQPIVQCVQRASKSSRGLRQTWPLLARDILALLAGLRRAVMLDYAAKLEPAALQKLVLEVQHHVRSAGDMLGIACLDGCCYLLRLDMLADKHSPDSEQQLFLSFSHATRGNTTCHWADRSHCQAVKQQLEPAMTLFAREFATLQSAGQLCPVLHMDNVQGLPILPTLNGWLLGYPLVYSVDQDSVDWAARFLGSVTLTLFHVNAVCAPLKAVLSRDWPGAMEQLPAALPLDRLLSFSAPIGAICTGCGGKSDCAPEISKAPALPENILARMQQTCKQSGHADFAAMWSMPAMSLGTSQMHVVL